jgi:DDE superfamily endonuclease
MAVSVHDATPLIIGNSYTTSVDATHATWTRCQAGPDRLRHQPLSRAVFRPCHGSAWARRSRRDRLPATYRRTHGIRYFHGCYCLGDDQLWGVIGRRKGGDHSLATLKSIRAARPDGAKIYVITDNLSANTTPAICEWAKKNKVELCFTPTYASWANPIEAHAGGGCSMSCGSRLSSSRSAEVSCSGR